MHSPENPEIKSDSLLIFHAGKFRCAVPVTDVNNVIRMVEITEETDISARNEGVVGSLIFHGGLIPVYSPGVFFGGRIPEPALTDNLILVNPASRNSALLVDRVDKVCDSEEIFNVKGAESGADKGSSAGIQAEQLMSEISGVKIYRRVFGNVGDKGDNNSFIDPVSSPEEIILLIDDINRFIDEGLKGSFSHISDYIGDTNKSEIFGSEGDFPEPKGRVAKSTGGLNRDQDTGAKASSYSDYVSYDFEQVRKVLRERREQIEKSDEKEEDSEKIEILRFRLMYAEYAVEMKYIREVLINEKITPIPGLPDYIMGIFALRGKIISLVNLRVLFSLPKAGITDLNRVIILSNGVLTFGVLADYITDIGTIPVNQLKVPDEKTSPIDIKYIKGIADDSLLILDSEYLLSDPQMVINEK